MSRTSVFLRSLVLTLCLGGVAFANVVNVANASFENPTLSSVGQYTDNYVPDWEFNFPGGFGDPYFGVFYPNPGNVPVPDGNQVLFAQASSSVYVTVYQDLTTNGLGNLPVQANTVYTLSAYVGAQSSNIAPFLLAFLVDDSYGDTNITSTDQCNGTVSAGANFILCSATFNSADYPSTVGHGLVIGLETTSDGSGSQILFDDVSVTATPEPGAFVLMIAGLAGIGIRRRWIKAA